MVRSVPATAPAAPDRGPVTRLSLMTAARHPVIQLLALLWAIVAVWLPLSPVRIAGLPAQAAVIGLFALFFVLYARLRPEPRLAEAVAYTGAWIAFASGAAILTYLCATPARPLRDADFAAFDSAIGFDWPAWAAWVRSHAPVQLGLRLLYDSLQAQIILSILLFAMTGRSGRNRGLLLAAILALLLTCLVQAVFPAVGPWAFFAVPGSFPDDTLYLQHLRALRGEDGPPRFDLRQIQGIIVLPSYHTVLGILFVWAHRGLWTALPVLALNLGMLASVPSEGGHYLADMLAGAAVTAVAIALAGRLGAAPPGERSAISNGRTGTPRPGHVI